MYHNCCCRFLLKIGLLILYFLAGVGIFLAGLLFGTSASAVLISAEILRHRVSDIILVFIYPTVAIAGLMFQPIALIIACIVLSLAILCFPITYKIIKNR